MYARRAAAALRRLHFSQETSPRPVIAAAPIHRHSRSRFLSQQAQAQLEERVNPQEHDEQNPNISTLFRSLEKRPDAVQALNEWISSGNKLSSQTLSSLYSWMTENKMFVQALKISSTVRQENLVPLTIPHYIFEIDVLCRQRGCSRGETLYKTLPEEVRSNEQVKTNFILSLSKQQQGAVQRVENWMLSFNDQVGIEAWNGALHMYLTRDKHPRIQSTYSRMIKAGIKLTPDSYHSLLRCRERVGGFEAIEDEALECLQKMNTETLDLAQLKRMMECYGYLRRSSELEKLWEEVKQRSPDEECYIGAIRAFGLLKDLSRAKEVFKDFKREMVKMPLSGYTAMIKVYSRLGMMENAEMLLKKHFSKENKNRRSEEKDKDFLPYDHIISGYLANDEPDVALEKYKEGIGASSRLQYTTVAGLLEVFMKKRDVDGAEELMEHYPAYYGDVYLYNKLLKVYAAAFKLPKDFRKRMVGQFAEPNQETEELLKKIAQAHGRKFL